MSPSMRWARAMEFVLADWEESTKSMRKTLDQEALARENCMKIRAELAAENAVLKAENEALKAERDMYKATADAVVCGHCDAENERLRGELRRIANVNAINEEYNRKAIAALGEYTC